MASKLKVDQIEGQSGTSVEVPTGHTFKVTDLGNNKILSTNSSGVVTATAMGSTDQVLKMTGSNTIGFGAISGGDVVKLGSVTASDTSYTGFDGLFTSDYKVYKIIMKRVRGTNDNGQVRVRYRNGSGAITSSVYKNFHQGGYFSSSSNTDLKNRSWNADHHNLTLNGLDNGVQYGLTAEYTLFEPQATDVHKNHICHMVHNVYDQTLFYNYTCAGAFDNTGAITGIDFYMASGNISGNFILYGLKE
tara:strand:+ start:330 stop:1070 length:741 start_codon:yes stop_codon:yes gene_type:complete